MLAGGRSRALRARRSESVTSFTRFFFSPEPVQDPRRWPVARLLRKKGRVSDIRFDPTAGNMLLTSLCEVHMKTYRGPTFEMSASLTSDSFADELEAYEIELCDAEQDARQLCEQLRDFADE